ncbi:MAG: MarR family winged helix-turn-helix transcriptional regulator [Acidobacteriota bacterium]|nr:MarR family winged helix-turn-helix transcriptional regulator [Acidobacteriota bacterium]
MTESLLDISLEVWQKVLGDEGVKNSIFSRRIDITQPEIELGTDDFSFLMYVYAASIGIDTEAFGRKLVGDRDRVEVLNFHVGKALKTLFEVEGHYVEIPHAFSIYKIPSKFLIVVGAAVIGIATGKAAQLDPLLGGAIGGVGSLLINILAARYTSNSLKAVEITWTEEFILKILENRDEQSIKELQKYTKLYRGTIKETLESLHAKNLVEKRKVLLEGKRVRSEIRYKLKSHS